PPTPGTKRSTPNSAHHPRPTPPSTRPTRSRSTRPPAPRSPRRPPSQRPRRQSNEAPATAPNESETNNTVQESPPCVAYQAPSTATRSPGTGGKTYSRKLARNRSKGAAGPAFATMESSRRASSAGSMLATSGSKADQSISDGPLGGTAPEATTSPRDCE